MRRQTSAPLLGAVQAIGLPVVLTPHFVPYEYGLDRPGGKCQVLGKLSLDDDGQFFVCQYSLIWNIGVTKGLKNVHQW